MLDLWYDRSAEVGEKYCILGSNTI